MNIIHESVIVEHSKLKNERECGVYFLIKNGKIVYVGQSVDVFSRLIAHNKDKDFDSWNWIPCDKSDLDFEESVYIHHLRPKQNGKRGHAETMTAPMSVAKLMYSMRERILSEQDDMDNVISITTAGEAS